MEQSSREAIQFHAIAITFPDTMLSGPSIVDINIKICKRLDDYNIVLSHRQLV